MMKIPCMAFLFMFVLYVFFLPFSFLLFLVVLGGGTFAFSKVVTMY
jgi:hypothetical protein